MAFKRIWHVTIALHPRLAAVSDAIRGCCLVSQSSGFDRPSVKCYKSAFCAALAPRLRGASPATLGVISDRRGGFFLVEWEQFALRSRLGALGRKSVPEAAVSGI